MPKADLMTRRAVILAGGKGSRLAPYTTVLPKPLLPIGDRAILDIVVHQLREADFTKITLAVGYLAHLVRAVMGDGTRHGIDIEYCEEDEPLGTVGPLATIEGLDDSFLVMNGDVLTTLDYGELLDIHREAGNVLTVASHRRTVRTEYGVLHLGGQNGDTNAIVGYEEKPEIPYIVSMGIYAMEPEALDFIEAGERLDLPDLVLRLLEAGKQVGTHLFDGYWLDIGRHEDYERAMHEYHSIREELRADPPKAPKLRSVRNL
jgi:NDP-sugar pyrophosphorylase family protein